MWNTLTDDERDIILEATAFGIQAEDAVKLLRLNEEDSIALLKDPELHREAEICLLYTSPSPRDRTRSRMPSSA